MGSLCVRVRDALVCVLCFVCLYVLNALDEERERERERERGVGGIGYARMHGVFEGGFFLVFFLVFF